MFSTYILVKLGKTDLRMALMFSLTKVTYYRIEGSVKPYKIHLI